MEFEAHLNRGPRPIIADGAIGTRLLGEQAEPATGPGQLRCVEQLNLTAADLVAEVHRSYHTAGAEITVTNTFCATSGHLAEYGLGDRVERINRAAVELARSETPDGWVLGSCGPVRSPDKAKAEYYQQISALAAGGVDALLIESVRSVSCLEAALTAATEVAGTSGKTIPILVSLCPVDDNLGLSDGSLYDFLSIIKSHPVTALGANCGDGAQLIFRTLATIRERYDGPLMARPSAGLPSTIDGRLRYPLSPDIWAQALLDWHRTLTLTIVGGCCGTTPLYIKRLKDQFYPSDTDG